MPKMLGTWKHAQPSDHHQEVSMTNSLFSVRTLLALNLSDWQNKTDTCTNSVHVDPNEMASKEWSHQDLHLFSILFLILK